MLQPWEEPFHRGILAFRKSEHEIALRNFNEAIELGGNNYKIYDSRAAAYEKLGRIKQALKDTRKAIELAPEMRHGYARSARLFLQQEKYGVASEMIRLALDRVHKDHPTLHSLEALKRTITDALEAQVVKRVASQTHISKLPVELISEVFILVAETDIVAPVVLSSICRHWRNVALRTPMLWKAVVLSQVRPEKKLPLWLKRSNNHIISLHIRPSISRPQLQDAFEICGSGLIKSLKSLQCHVEVPILTSCLADIPNVEQLDLDDIRLSNPVCRRSVFPTMESLDALLPSARMSNAHTLIVEDLTVDWPAVTPRLSNLRILIIRTGVLLPKMTVICTLVAANLRLEKIILESPCPMGLETGVVVERVTLPYLTHLELLGPMNAKHMVERLKLPLLEHFAISRSLSPADQVLLAIEPLPVALVELSVRNCFFADQSLSAFLRMMSGLTKLEITHSAGDMDIVVDAIAGSSEANGETKLTHPLLRHVDFSYSMNLNGGPIVRLVKPRLPDNVSTSPAQPPARIESIYLDGCPRIHPSVPQWLRGRVQNVSCVYLTKSQIKKIRQ